MGSDSVTFTFVVLSFTRLVPVAWPYCSYGPKCNYRYASIVELYVILKVKKCYGKVCEPRHKVRHLQSSLPPPHTPVLFKGWYKRIIQGYLVTIDIERSHCM